MKAGQVLSVVLSVIVTLVVAALAVYIIYHKNAITIGSVPISNEYHSTRVAFGATATTSPVSSGTRVLGSVVITSSTPTFTLYDWDGTTSTVSTTLAVFKPGIAEGTYTYDVALVKGGLYYYLPATNTGSFAITWR